MSTDAPGEAGIVRSSTVMAVGTVASRLTGFVRNVVLVAALGQAIFADTFTIANTVPNIIYILLVGGALNSVFVPQLVRAMKRDDDGGEAYAQRLLTLTALVLLAIAAVATLLAPVIIRLWAHDYTHPGFEDELALSTTFARYCLPQIFFYGLFVMLGQVLNARNRFGPMMFAPVLNNVVAIAVFGAFIAISSGPRDASTITPGETFLLGAGSTLGVALQALALVPYLRGAGVRWRPRFDFRGVGLGRAGDMAKWTLLFVAVNQLGYLVVVNLLSSTAVKAADAGIHEGVGYTPYSTAYLLLLLPHSVVTVSLVTALLPRMSRAAAEGDLPGVRADISAGLRLSAVASIPSALLFLVLGPDIAVAIFAHGHNTVASARVIGDVLAAFALGLVPFSAHHLVLRGFYALEDTRTPFFVTIWINVANVLLALAVYATFPVRRVVVGMAGAYALSYVVGLTVSARILRARIGGLDGSRVVRTMARLTCAGLLGALMAAVVSRVVGAVWGAGWAPSAAAVLLGGVAGGGLYLAVAVRLRVAEVATLLGMLRGRMGAPG